MPSASWTTRVLIATAALVVLCATPASATDPGRWNQTGRSTIPFEYYQGVTHDDRGDVYFNGVYAGLYRTDTRLREEARSADVIDPAARSDPGFNHIGDITWDEAEGGRIVLPLECYDPSREPSNTCGIGGLGVADPDTLQWKYWVRLDPADIPKAMWAEVAPDGRRIWTSSGQDLLAYDAADLTPANAQPGGATIRPVRRIVGAVPAHGITGAVFVGPRLFVAGQRGARFQVTSIDLTSGIRRLEIEETINGESEGLDSFDGRGGRLHWMVLPLSQTGPPTFRRDRGTLLHYRALPTRLELSVSPTRAKAGSRTRFLFRVTDDNDDPVKGATVTLLDARARTDARGRASVRRALPSPGRYAARATKRGVKAARVLIRSSR